MLAVERDAWADDLHVASPVVANGLAGTEWNAVLALELHLLLEEEVRQFGVRRELEAQRLNDPPKEVAQRLLPGISVHGVRARCPKASRNDRAGSPRRPDRRSARPESH